MIERRLRRRTVFRGRILSLHVDDVETSDGHEAEREIVEHPGAVGVVCVDGDEVVLVRQYRYATGEEMLELPAGLLEVGESPEDTATRELVEEAGLRARSLEHLATYFTTAGFCSERFHLYFTDDVEPAERVDHPGEVLVVDRRPLSSVPELLRSGEVRNGPALLGLALLALRLQGRDPT